MKHVRGGLDRVSPSAYRSRRSGIAAVGTLFLPAIALAADPLFGDLPADIVKERPSASVPADLPGSRSDPCALYTGMRVFVPMRGAVVDTDPAALTGGNGCAGAPPAPAPGGEPPFGDTWE